VKAWRDNSREQAATHKTTVEAAQVETALRVGIDVLSSGMQAPAAGAVQQLRQRINSLASQPG
jgi:hypothetical protein